MRPVQSRQLRLPHYRKAKSKDLTKESIEERLRESEAKLHRLKGSIKTIDERIHQLELAATDASSSRQTFQVSSPSFIPPRTRDVEGTGRAGSKYDLVDEPISREFGCMNLDRTSCGRFMGSSSGTLFIGTAEQRFSNVIKPSERIGDKLLRVDTDELGTDYPICGTTTYHLDLPALPPKATAMTHFNGRFDTW
ncbi:hypothetical protein K469DRAFT_686260 [Zopfia rhizophila CBS 207.26]|uniref:Uncharacterized protein n=1 Tax=Zopfia rhizophila CBS 207.26 TaxID=1314779 RepID=A0A6A6E910_9PEZI|nr:hypothetical protein K469DRAFT_686260 [Zopfia rhizophila CBS 207.26]